MNTDCKPVSRLIISNPFKQRSAILAFLVGLLSVVTISMPVAGQEEFVNSPFEQAVEAQLNNNVTGFNRDSASARRWIDEFRQRETNTRTILGSASSGDVAEFRRAIGEWNQMIEACYRLRNNLLTSLPGQSDAIDNVLLDAISRAEQTARNMVQVASTVENADVTENRNVAIRNAARTTPGRSASTPRRPTTAGDVMDGVDISLDHTFASFSDRGAGGSGHDSEFSLSLGRRITEQLELGLVVSRSRYDIGGPTSLERNSDSADAYLIHSVNDHLAVGGFINFTRVDIEDAMIVDPLLGPVSLADTFDRWAAGFNVAVSEDFDTISVGLTSSIASSDNQSLATLFDHKNATWTTIADMTCMWTDQLATTCHASYFTAVHNVADADGSFWMIGGDVSFSLSDRIQFNVGYETTLGFKDYRENRINGGVTIYF